MAIIEHDRVWETVTVTGTGSITLPGTPAAVGARTFVSVYANGDQCPYSIIDGTTGDSETGVGTLSISAGVATLARTVVIESTNANAAVSFGGNSCAVLVAKLPGVQTSAGSADAGKVPILGSGGQIDSSMIPSSGGGSVMPFPSSLTGAWISNGIGNVDGLYGTKQNSYTWQGWQQYMPFLWLGGAPIQAVGINILTAATTAGGIRVGLMSITGYSAGTLISELTSSNQIPTGATGFQTATLASPLTPAPGWYILQFVLGSGSSPTVGGFRYAPGIATALMGSGGGFVAGNQNNVMRLTNAGATTLASSLSGGTAFSTLVLPDFQLGT